MVAERVPWEKDTFVRLFSLSLRIFWTSDPLSSYLASTYGTFHLLLSPAPTPVRQPGQPELSLGLTPGSATSVLRAPARVPTPLYLPAPLHPTTCIRFLLAALHTHIHGSSCLQRAQREPRRRETIWSSPCSLVVFEMIQPDMLFNALHFNGYFVPKVW